MDHLQIIADALRLVIEQSHIGSRYHVNSKDDGGTRYVTGSRNDVATYLAKAIRIDRQSVALRQTLDQQQIDLLEARLNDPRPYAKKYSAVEAAVAKADRQEKLDLLEDRLEAKAQGPYRQESAEVQIAAYELLLKMNPEDFKGLPKP